MPSFFVPDSHPLIGGDFNCFDFPLDKMGGTVSLDSNLINLKIHVAFGMLGAPFTRVKYTWFNLIASRFFSAFTKLAPVVSDHEF